MDKIAALLSALFVEGSPEQRARTFRAAFRIFVAGFMLWGAGYMGAFGLGGFARADEVDTKIQSAIEPVRAQLGAITTQLATQDDVLKSIRIDQLATKLRELHRVCCAAAAADEFSRERMKAEIESTQRQYRALAGERYPLPEHCEQ